MNNALYIYKKDLDIFSYHEFKRDKTHYEQAFLPNSAKKEYLTHFDSINFYYRFLNYSKHFERFFNSYLWVSFEESNLILEKYESLLEYNDYLNKHLDTLKTFISENENEPNFDPYNLYSYVNIKLKELSQKEFNASAKDLKIILAEKEKVLIVKRILKLDFFIKNIILSNDVILKSSYSLRDKDSYIYYYYLKKEYEYIFFDKLKNNELNITLAPKYICNNSILKVFDLYKNSLFLGLYYDYIIENNKLFKVDDDFDYLNIFNNIKKNIYMSEVELLNEILVNNLSYYKNFFNHLNTLYQEIEHDLDIVCNDVFEESNNILIRMQNMLKILLEITDNKIYDKEQLLLKKLKLVTEEFSNFKIIFSNFNAIFKDISQLCEEFNDNTNKFNKNIKEGKDEVLFFNYSYLLDYLANNDIDLEPFDESIKLIEDILNNFNELPKKLDSFKALLDEKYVFFYNEDFNYDMHECEQEINESVNYFKLKRKYKYST